MSRSIEARPGDTAGRGGIQTPSPWLPGSPKRKDVKFPVSERTHPFRPRQPGTGGIKATSTKQHGLLRSGVMQPDGSETGTSLGKIKAASLILICKCHRYYPSRFLVENADLR